VTTVRRALFNTAVGVALVLAVVGWPLEALAIVGVLWVLMRLEPSP